MAKNRAPRVDETHIYTVQEASPLLELTAETIKKKCREREINCRQKGAKGKWHIKGKEILRLRELWNLDDDEDDDEG